MSTSSISCEPFSSSGSSFSRDESCSCGCDSSTQCTSGNDTSSDNCPVKCRPKILKCLPRDAIPIRDLKAVFPQERCEYQRRPERRRPEYQDESPPRNRERFEGFSLEVLINPLVNLTALDSGLTNGAVMIHMRRRNNTVTMQWEPFKGQLQGRGIRYLTIGNTLTNMPVSPVQFLIRMEYNGIGRIGYLSIDPNVVEKFQFHFDVTGQSEVRMNDYIKVHGGAVTWITKD